MMGYLVVTEFLQKELLCLNTNYFSCNKKMFQTSYRERRVALGNLSRVQLGVPLVSFMVAVIALSLCFP